MTRYYGHPSDDPRDMDSYSRELAVQTRYLRASVEPDEDDGDTDDDDSWLDGDSDLEYDDEEEETE